MNKIERQILKNQLHLMYLAGGEGDEEYKETENMLLTDSLLDTKQDEECSDGLPKQCSFCGRAEQDHPIKEVGIFCGKFTFSGLQEKDKMEEKV